MTIRVTPENFERAETDLVFSGVAEEGAFGAIVHTREPMPINAAVLRPNRDTLYSRGLFDLEAAPVMVEVPDGVARFLSMQVIDEDQYTPMVVYEPGRYTLTRTEIGTRYVLVAFRIFVDPRNARDVREAHALQDAIGFEQKNSGVFEMPEFDVVSQNNVRSALLRLGETLSDTLRMFGARGEVDPVKHLIGTAIAFGGNPERDALYLNVTPTENDGRHAYELTVERGVPIDGLWSISVYDENGRFVKNAADAYTANSVTAEKNGDGSISVRFGRCNGTPNCLPVVHGWNYLVRLYRPRREILDGTWTFPDARLVT